MHPLGDTGNPSSKYINNNAVNHYSLLSQSYTMAGRLQPLELVDKCIGSRIWIVMKVALSVLLSVYS